MYSLSHLEFQLRWHVVVASQCFNKPVDVIIGPLRFVVMIEAARTK